MRGFERGGEGEAARLVRPKPDDDDLVGRAAKDLAGKSDAIVDKGDAGDGGVQVQFAAVIVRGICQGEGEEQIGQGFVRHFAEGTGHHFFARQRLGVGVLAGKDQAADFGQGEEGVRVGGIVRAAAVKGALIELEALLRDAPKDHRAEAAIAQRKGLDPFFRRTAVPQREGREGVGLGGGANLCQ